MRSLVGLLLIASGLFLVVGCVSPNGSLSRSDDFGFGSKTASKPFASSEPSTDKKLTFKAPRSKSRSKSGVTAVTEAASNQQAESDRLSASKNNVDGSEFAPGYSSDISQEARSRSSETFADRAPRGNRGNFDPQDSNVAQASGRRSDDDLSGAVQLQGLEFDASETPNKRSASSAVTENAVAANQGSENWTPAKQRETPSGSPIQNWVDRPADPQGDPLAKSRTGHSLAAAPLEQTSHTGTPHVSAKAPAADLLPPLPWQTDLEQLIARVEQNLAQSKSENQAESLRQQAHLRLLYLMAQRQEEALMAIPGATTSQQEYWQQMIWAMSNSFDTIRFPDADERAAQAISPLSSALRQMREEASLSIKNMTFCRKISYFGNYERFPRNEFIPGHEVLLYTEIENFVSAPTVDGEYRTSLKSLIEIADAKGQIVWTKGFAPTEDFCRNPRRDYFHNYQFHIPEDLPTGAYSLKLTISDELSHKRVSNSLNFVLK